MAVPGEARPQPSGLTAPFWEAAHGRQLVRPRCLCCGRSFFTPQIACTHCLSEDWEWAASTGLGALYSFTTVSRAPMAGFLVPYLLAVVDLDEGWSMLSRLVGVPPAEACVGMRVCVSWAVIDATLTIPVFRPFVEDAR